MAEGVWGTPPHVDDDEREYHAEQAPEIKAFRFSLALAFLEPCLSRVLDLFFVIVGVVVALILKVSHGTILRLADLTHKLKLTHYQSAG
jgi:hypothetical protein